MARVAISKKLRFEIFKRDSFKCQYCGKSAPDVILHVDHINPVKRGGKNDSLNLITSCIDCNLGKGAVTLDDNSVISKQQKQLQEISERREQLKLMTKWRDELLKLEEDKVDYINERISEITGYELSESGKSDMRKTIKKYGLDLTIDSLEKSANQYLSYDNKDNLNRESVDKFINYIPRICAGTKKENENPSIKEIAYICGILKNRLGYYDKARAWKWLMQAHENGVSIDELKCLAKTVSCWTDFRSEIEEYLI